jgi:hypothetical protein
MQIRIERWPITAVAYHVLAHLDLGRDAASLYDDTLPARPWTAALREAYAAARGRLAVHGAPLWYGDRLVARLREGVPAMLRDAEGRALALALADAIEVEAPTYVAAFERDARPLDDVATEIVEPLARLRAALWERTGAAPPLVIVDCPALGKRARAAKQDDARVVATDCMQPIEWLACQVLHEEIHAITDDAVLAGRDARTRDTRAGTPGYALHDELERAAIEVGDALVQARAPEWAPAYARWRATFDRRT